MCKIIAMVKKSKYQGKEIYLCDACGFGYRTKDLARKCEDYCKNQKACSFEITQHAVFTPDMDNPNH